MHGWIILFALLSLTGVTLSAFGRTPAGTTVIAGGAVFAFLFFASILTRVLRSEN